MKVRPCDTCGNMVSISAASCPNCGSTTCNADLRRMERNIAKVKKAGIKAYIIPALIFFIGVAGMVEAENFMHVLISIVIMAVGGGIGFFMVKTTKDMKDMYNKKIDSFQDSNY